MKNTSFIALALVTGLLGWLGCTEFETLPDSGAVMIGTQEWMVVNLDTDTFQNGDPIPHAPTLAEWAEATESRQPAWCYYKNDPENGALFGRLYNFYAVIDPRGLAPAGWHIPSLEEWEFLYEYVGSTSDEISGALKSDRLWVDYENAERGENSFGFTALPGSYRMKTGDYYPYVDQGPGYVAYFWSRTPASDTGAYALRLTSQLWIFETIIPAKGTGASVRCLRGALNPPDPGVIGTQEWMIRNLDTDTFRNGEPIPTAHTPAEWVEAATNRTPAWCYYMDNPENGTLYGRLYNWYAVTDPRGLAPSGWKVPDDMDWKELEAYLSESGLDGGALKSETGWANPQSWDSNVTGFSALPGQMRFENASFYEGAELALFWSTHEINDEKAEARGLHGEVNNFSEFFHLKGAGLSVRCLRE
jgi:uncharacterized protein (TIGR02145 family)